MINSYRSFLLIELGLVGLVIFLRFLYLIGRKLFEVRKRFAESGFEDSSYYYRLNKALIAVFWMYAVYSLNYWGLSQYYWYLFGGLVIAFGRQVANSSPAETSDASGDIAYRKRSRQQSRFPLAGSIRG